MLHNFSINLLVASRGKEINKSVKKKKQEIQICLVLEKYRSKVQWNKIINKTYCKPEKGKKKKKQLNFPHK